MEFLAPFHPQIVHTPVALLVFSAFFAIVGRLFDREWVRKAAMLLLVFGFLGAILANLSGNEAEERAEERQGVPEAPLEAHELAGRLVLYVSGGALLAFAVGSRLSGGAKGAIAGLALLLQIAAAVLVGVAGLRGGRLVYDYAAGVSVGGTLVKHPAGARPAEAAHDSGEAGEHH